jgi:hypothetical protein
MQAPTAAGRGKILQINDLRLGYRSSTGSRRGRDFAKSAAICDDRHSE